MVKKTPLGNKYYERAKQYPDMSHEFSAWMDIVHVADDFDDAAQVIKVLEEERLPRYRELADPQRKYLDRALHWQKRIVALEQALKEFKQEEGVQ